MADGDQGAETLTKRELEVASAYASGESYKEIARTLGLSPTTVRTHLRTVYTKLGVTSKIELARFLEGSAVADQSLDQSEVTADLALELDDAIRRERSLSRILKIISDQNEDLDTVIDAVLDHALEICEAQFGILFEYQGDMMFRELRSRNISPEFAEWLTEQQTFKVEPGTGIGRVASDLQPVNIADVRGEDIYQSGAPLRIATADFGKARSFAAIPMMSGGRLIGAFTVYRTRVHPFNDRALELASAFADQAVIAIENVRQFREVQTRLEREAVNRELLELISLNRDDEQPIFDVIVQRARALCNADVAGLILGQEGGPPQRVAAHSGTSEQMLNAYNDGLFPMDPKLSAGARCIVERRVVLLEDAPNDELYRRGSTERQTAVLREGIRSNLHVPLIADGLGIGCLVLARRSLRPYLPEEISLVEAFAAQAIIAIENVRQFREVQTRLEREAVNREILHLISQNRDDEKPIFEFILESACRLCKAQSAFVIILDESGEFVYSPAQFGTRPDFTASFADWRVPIATSPLGAVVSMRERRVVAFDDIADDDLYRSGHPDRVRQVEIEGSRSVVNVPLMTGEGAVGSIILYRREVRPFTDEDIALVEAFAAQAVIAVENVRQFRELQTRLERQKAAREILQVISENRDDEQPVFDFILKSAAGLCGSPMARLELADENRDTFRCVAAWGDEMRSFSIGETLPLDLPNDLPTAIREGEVRHITDLSKTELYLKGDHYRTRMVDDEGYRTYLVVPLISGGNGIGGIVLSRREVAPFADTDIALVENFAAQAVIAIENVRQFREVQARLEREAATREVLGVISESRDDESPVFQVILENACRLCEAKSAFMIVLDDSGEFVYSPADFGASPEFAAVFEEWRAPYATSPLGAVSGWMRSRGTSSR
ncbi:MAG: GAF domain-containing protein, partial [Pseudomonadota bacterium]